MNYSLRDLRVGFISCFFDKKIRSIYLCTSFTIGNYTAILNYISYPLTEPPFSMSQSLIGFIYVATLSGVFGSIIFGRFIGQIFDISLYRIALFTIFIGVIFTVSNFIWLVIVGLLLVSFGLFASNAIASNWIANNSPEQYKTEANSLYSIFYYVGSSVIGWLSGYLFSFLGWTFFMILIGFILLILILFIGNVREHNINHKLLDVNR
ncbi:MFS transporter [Alkalihalobacillus pseudalcaliphilus]|uniref:MFS transporter n=1 Tax=Alkalihalobacillus pseudalcaliphilus TaxID=79884 RepID=UPI00064DC335|nr:MFS transporter [Alkalihalobacillus pseudalcaliphilus]KMK76528.1 hypothetical protein AB990_15255 [Alkalihalobacillus pseudalcaliphilus]